MRLKVSLQSGGTVDDVLVTIDSTATVGQLAEHLRRTHPRSTANVSAGPSLGLRVVSGAADGRTIDAGALIGESGIRSGDTIVLTNASADASGQRPTVATLNVLSGPDVGRSFPLASGTTVVGRDRSADVRLSDPLVSKRHAKVNVTDMVEVIDDNSANGVLVGSEPVQRAVLRSADEVRVGDTVFTVALHLAAPGSVTPVAAAVEFNRSPRLDPMYAGVELIAPEPPQRPQPQRFPWISVLAPLVMGAVLFAVTKSALSIAFILLSPIMGIGSFFENRWSTKRAMEQSAAEFRASLRDLSVQLQYAADKEKECRRREQPSVGDVVDAATVLAPLLWTRRPDEAAFRRVRLGLATQVSRNSVKLPTTNNTTPELWRELHDVAGQFSTVDRVPVVADLAAVGNIGIGGPATFSHGLAAAVIAQLVGLHSPAELVLAAVCDPVGAERWSWLKWLPHAGGDHWPLPVEPMAASRGATISLIAALEELLAQRGAGTTGASGGAPPLPAVVVLVEDAAAAERARLVRIAESGPSVGVHLVWVAPSVERVPAACHAFLAVDPNTGVGHAGFTRTGEGLQPVELEPLEADAASSLGRRLSSVVDAGAVVEDQSDLPRSVSFLTLADNGVAENVSDVLEAWRGSNSLPADAGAARPKRENTLRALVGQSASDRFYLDLRTHGPHALVGGTTGAGKSEFLQSWVLGMATAHSPARVNFLFVDYKGGAAFADCVQLPHCVGLVTDLSPHLVRRALRSLDAELRRREHILNSKKAKDLLELERRRDPECPPSLVIVVDEFAALVQEVPEFVDGVVNVAQRGRSLGLHLILATQRPAGVIKDNLRANTNLRVALRMADEGDSDDVIGTKQAATFDPSIPGRAVAKTGPGRLTMFQSAYVGGHTTNEPPEPSIDVADLKFGRGATWESTTPDAPRPEPMGANDIARVVENVRVASDAAGLPPVTRPWLPELTPLYRLEQLPTPRTDAELIYGVIDLPEEQDQPTVAFVPDRDGNMAIFGTGGSGKSTALRTIAVAAGFSSARGGPCHVYALDFGSRSLAMLESMPHVGAVITADDQERTIRLLRHLRSTIDERAERYARVNAATVQEYRERAGEASEPRILLLVDNFGAFRSMYELNYQARAFELLESIASDGRGVGVHVIATADQAGVFTASMNSVIQSRLALRLSSEMDFSILGVPTDVFSEASPPGRGFMDDSEVQVAVIGGESNIAKQAAEMAKLAQAMERAGVVPAPVVAKLAELIPLHSLPGDVAGLPVLGLRDDTLQPMPFEPSGVFVVAGPAQSGRTTTVATMVTSLANLRPNTRFVLFGARRTTLSGVVPWDVHCSGPDDVSTAAYEVAEQLSADADRAAATVVVIEGVGDHSGSLSEDSLTELLKVCRQNDAFVIAEGETSTLSGWGFLQSVRLNKYGIVLQPDEGDGDTLFGTSFPRVRRAEFPTGRGLFVRAGRLYRVQVATPD